MTELIRRIAPFADFAPGYKTYATGVVMALINLANALGVVNVSPDLAPTINAFLGSLIGLFIAMKIDRERKLREGREGGKG